MTNINELLERLERKAGNITISTCTELEAAQVIREQQQTINDVVALCKEAEALAIERGEKLALAVEALSKLNEHYYADNGKSLIREALAKLKEKL